MRALLWLLCGALQSAAMMRLPPSRLFPSTQVHKISTAAALQRVEEEWMCSATDVHEWEPLLLFMAFGAAQGASVKYDMYELRDDHSGGCSVPWMAVVQHISPAHFECAYVAHHPALKSESLWCDDTAKQELSAALCVFEGRRAARWE